MGDQANEVQRAASAEKPGMRMICPACNEMYDDEYVCKGCGAGLLEIPDAPLLSGKLLDGRYDVEGVIGTGGMGTVYRARQRGMEREVAIKVLHPHYAHQPRAVKRFFREAQAASKLVHPNIVTVYDFGRSIDGHLYMVMEMLEGWTLGDLIHYRAPLSAPLAITIARQVCDALGEAHKHRIVHRDLKPDNVLVTMTDDGLWAKVLDFGIARSMRDKDADLSVNESTVEIAGTPAYMSPEQILGKEPDTRSDLYALGIILFEMLTKQRPFDDESSVALCMKQLNDVPPPVSDLAPDAKSLDSIVAALLEKKVGARPAHAADVKALLEACPDCHAPVEHVQIDNRPHQALGVKTTRADQAMMMVQPTLESSDSKGASLADVLGRVGQNSADEPALRELSELTFPKREAHSVFEPRGASARSASPRGPVCLVAQLLVEHAAVLTSGVVASWLGQHKTAGWGVSRDAQKATLRVHAALKGDPATVRKDAIDALVMLQRESLDHNVALRIGVVGVGEPREIAPAIDLAQRLAASSAHGRVSMPKDLQAALALEAAPQTHVYLPDGRAVESAAVGPNRRGDARELLWGRSVPLRRLGQFADEARRSSKLITGLVVGPRGIGKTALVR
ncbi:MAG: serine/threonine protein kinase, partial [Myxococcota bacterium]